MLMQSPVQEVTAYGTTSKSEYFAPYEYPTTTVSLLKFADGKVGKVTSCIDCLQPYYFHSHLVGSHGTLLDTKLHTTKLPGMIKTKWSELATHPIDSGDVSDHPYQPQFQAFVDATLAGTSDAADRLRHGAREPPRGLRRRPLGAARHARAAVGTRVAAMPRVLALMAHPDDIEITCAGTLILLKAAGWDVHLATMTAGDLGSATLPAAAISRIRRKEAAASAALLGAGYTCLGIPDLTIAHSERHKRIVTGLLRAVRPDLLITHPPVDYMADHEQTSYLARDAAFGSTIPNWKALPPIGARGREGGAAVRGAAGAAVRRPDRPRDARRQSRQGAATSWTSRRCSSRRRRCSPRTPRSARGCTSSTARTSTCTGCAGSAPNARRISASDR